MGQHLSIKLKPHRLRHLSIFPPIKKQKANPRRLLLRLRLPFRSLAFCGKPESETNPPPSSPAGRHGDDSQRRERWREARPRREAPGGIVLPAALADQARQGELELLLLLTSSTKCKAGIRYWLDGADVDWNRRRRRRRRPPRPKLGRRRRRGRARAPYRGRSCFRSARSRRCVGVWGLTLDIPYCALRVFLVVLPWILDLKRLLDGSCRLVVCVVPFRSLHAFCASVREPVRHLCNLFVCGLGVLAFTFSALHQVHVFCTSGCWCRTVSTFCAVS